MDESDEVHVDKFKMGPGLGERRAKDPLEKNFPSVIVSAERVPDQTFFHFCMYYR